MPGKVFLVGAGPGAPDLITVRGAEILKRSDIVFYDALVHPGTLALAQRAEKIAVGKRCGRHSTAQRFINKRLIDAARKHAVVVRLKGGDPMLFGRAQEEIAALAAAGIEHEVIPGVTAALAASAEVGISLTQRGVARSVAFATARSAPGTPAGEWVEPVLRADTAVIYMGAGQAAEIARTLLARGLPPALPVVVVENATLPQSRCLALTLAELPGVEAWASGGPVLILLGEAFRAALPTAARLPATASA
ncbi:MAG: uroporphyrinogen-III C-methyltransferase [Betaproteobacteria bacterium]|nr:uroporphyrinogen-III C-methyltransferase [Betaproteobacteria bacterium]